MSLHGERETGAAKRRRERRLRSWLERERQTVRVVLAETFHHSSAPFPPKFKEELVGRHEQHDALRRQKTARTTVATHFLSSTMVARGPELFSLEEEPGGGRPTPLSEVAGWQGRLERHNMEDLGSVCPFVQILDLPVPQTVDCVEDALRILDRPMAEQVIEVPKISCSPCPSRSLILSFAGSGTVGGSADRLVSCAHRGADRRHSSSSWSWQAACSMFSPKTEFNSGAFFCGTHF